MVTEEGWGGGEKKKSGGNLSLDGLGLGFGATSASLLVEGHRHTFPCKPTFILLPAVVGRPFFSAFRFSGNSARMKLLMEDTRFMSKREKALGVSVGAERQNVVND